MTLLISRLFRTFVFLLLLISWGCTQYEGADITEQKHPQLVKARELIKAQRLQEAAEICQKLLRSKPDFAYAHLQLGMIYQSLDQPVNSMYHYQMYLQLRPDSVKRDTLEELIEGERLRFGEGLGSDSAPEQEELMLKLEQRERELAKARLELEQLRLRQPGQQAEPASWAQEKLDLLAEIERLRSAEPVIPPTPTPTPAPRQYVVQSGDTLSKIALKMYGKSSEWDKIYEANRDVLPAPERLSRGQVLRIP